MRRDPRLAAALALAGAALGCRAPERDLPPLLTPASDARGAAIGCDELRATDDITDPIPGMLELDGGPAGCAADGLECALPDLDGGVCDGGADAAAPVAECRAGVWFGGCVPRGSP